jgi:hypothetical protein
MIVTKPVGKGHDTVVCIIMFERRGRFSIRICRQRVTHKLKIGTGDQIHGVVVMFISGDAGTEMD